ncbi:DUF4386 domain-containing protein [Winogradskyella immobilis]|uniref:DUF4386 domain-containing protein n=1 Tax=Winogradskyella immobilis TaxID=2816852 RepID=A0ABS8EKS9_9FLAO|nr:DUF4386 domain-containing protein [Winogradskyella immobilis]MCC1483536.1 DUF4386 domain-containing protein [Winogradskyella immobilis]MCG0015630.1 DUF4386 domain-containing protein [Winogradskyella immobilis]
MKSTKQTARQAGFLYLLVAIFGGFAHFGVRMKLIVYNDAEVTSNNILSNEFLFRFGFVADIIQLTCFIFLLLILYRLLKSISKIYAKVMFLLAIVGISIACLNMLNQYAVLTILKGQYLETFNTSQIHSLSMLFLELHNVGYAIAHIFFGLWLFPLGYLVYKSGFIPKIIGILLMIATFGYLINMLTGFLFPGFETITSYGALFSGLAELIFIIWLLIKGVRVN